MTETVRTHDRIYLRESRYENPKELFKFTAGVARRSGMLAPGQVVADIGCAAGEFLYYLNKSFPGPRYAGYDLRPDLIDKARRMVPATEFRVGSVLDPGMIEPNSLDVAFFIGVQGIFESFEASYANLLTWVRPGGAVYVYSAFNPFPVDVWVKYRAADDNRPEFETGWNYFSERSVSRFLESSPRVKSYKFIPFVMPIDLPPHEDDPVRTWTIKLEDGTRALTNGLGLLRKQQVLEIRL